MGRGHIYIYVYIFIYIHIYIYEGLEDLGAPEGSLELSWRSSQGRHTGGSPAAATGVLAGATGPRGLPVDARVPFDKVTFGLFARLQTSKNVGNAT